MAETTYIRQPLTPATVAGDIRDMANMVQACLIPFGSQLGIINSQLSNEYYNCINNAWSCIVGAAEKRELRAMYGNTETIDIYCDSLSIELRSQARSLFNGYFYWADKDDAERSDCVNLSTADIKKFVENKDAIHNGFWKTGQRLHSVWWDDFPLNDGVSPTAWHLIFEKDHIYLRGLTYYKATNEYFWHDQLPHCKVDIVYQAAIDALLAMLGDRYVKVDIAMSVNAVYEEMLQKRQLATPITFKNVFSIANEKRDKLDKESMFVGGHIGEGITYIYISEKRFSRNDTPFWVAFYIHVIDGAIVTSRYELLQRSYESFDRLNRTLVDYDNRVLTKLFESITDKIGINHEATQLEFEI